MFVWLNHTICSENIFHYQTKSTSGSGNSPMDVDLDSDSSPRNVSSEYKAEEKVQQPKVAAPGLLASLPPPKADITTTHSVEPVSTVLINIKTL